MRLCLRYVRNPLMYIVVLVMAGCVRAASPLDAEVVETSWFLAVIMLAFLNTAAIMFSGELLSTSEFAYEGDRWEFIDFPSSDLSRVTVLSTVIAAVPHVVNGLVALICFVVGSAGIPWLLSVVLITTAYRLYNTYNNWLSRRG